MPPALTTTPITDLFSPPNSVRQATWLRSRLGALLLFIAALAVAMSTLTTISDQEELRRNAADSVANSRDALSAIVRANLDQSYGAILQLEGRLRGSAAGGGIDADKILGGLRAQISVDHTNPYLFVVGMQGAYVVGSKGTEDRALEAALRMLSVAPTVTMRNLGEPIFLDSERTFLYPVYVRSEFGDARFAVGALLPPSAFQLPATRRHGDAEGYGVFRSDGVVLWREPGGPDLVGRKFADAPTLQAALTAPSGVLTADSAVDQRRAIMAYQKLVDYPVVVTTGQAEDYVLAPWWRRLWLQGAFRIAFLLLLALAWWLFRSMVERISESQTFFLDLFHDVMSPVLILDRQARLLVLNGAARALFGIDDEMRWRGQSITALLQVPARSALHGAAPFLLRLGETADGAKQHFETAFRRPNGESFECSVTLSSFTWKGECLVFCALRDNTLESRYLRLQEHLATHDPLTGALNREGFVRAIDEHIAGTAEGPAHVIVLDLDDFRDINETFGHVAGDRVLAEVCRRVAEAFEEFNAPIARLGGDDIGVFLIGEFPEDALLALCQRLLARIKAPITLEGIQIEPGAAIGVASYPSSALESRRLLRCADIAMHAAKSAIGSAEFYRTGLDLHTPESLALRADLGHAIREGQLCLAFQPKIRLSDRRLLGAEALCRWRHPTRGFIPPSIFIPIAEGTELIHPLTRWVIRTTLAHLARWNADGQALRVAINISALNLQDPEFVPFLRHAISASGVAEAQVELEVTETAIMQSSSLAASRLRDIRAMGVTVAIDDFGVGSSSLSYITMFPITSIKLDRSFIDNMVADRRTRSVVASTIDMAMNIGAMCVAEGVDSAASVADLMEMGCYAAQGFHFAKPMFEEEFHAWAIAWTLRLAEAA